MFEVIREPSKPTMTRPRLVVKTIEEVVEVLSGRVVFSASPHSMLNNYYHTNIDTLRKVVQEWDDMVGGKDE